MLGPLRFPSSSKSIKEEVLLFGNESKVSKCFLCESQFNICLQETTFLQHIFDEHKMVIADVSLIADLSKYVEYWRLRLRNIQLKDVCTTLLVDVNKDGAIQPNQEYFLLGDVLPEDKKLREGLQQQKLEFALNWQEFEREDETFKRNCLFCNIPISGNRAQYLDHLACQHNLQLGHPHNLVFIDELINKLEEKLEALQCLYCEKVFKDKFVLKEHMRKKLWHKRINPENKEYDKFYIINYLEPGKTWKDHQISEREAVVCNEDSEWSDWTENNGDAIVCLFCPHPSNSWSDVSLHLVNEHGFNYEQLTSNLNFYQQVKLVNYIRRQVYRQCCLICDKSFDTNNNLLAHMKQAEHLILPPPSLWDQPEYYFSTYDNDLFLCQIEDIRDAEEDEETNKKLVSSQLLEEHKELIESFQKLLSEP